MHMEKCAKEAKCLVWDLDNTLWDGVLTEPEAVRLKPGIKELITELDARGIINSIASRNNHEDAISKLREFGLEEYFLYPQINWNSKAESLKTIQQRLNIGMDAIVFIDDQPFERDEVASVHPELQTMDAAEYLSIAGHPRFNPLFITADAKRRRLMYLEDMQRTKDEEEYKGPKEEFLASLNMEFIISTAKEEDLQRAEELTVRTNQLNATGRTYSYDELYAYMHNPNYRLYVCELTDRYGSYGKIGLALVEITAAHWCLHMLLMSCRVLSRSAGSILLTYIMRQAFADGKKLQAHFRQTGRNRMMYITYRFANFQEIENDGNGNILFENDLAQLPPFPPYVSVLCPEPAGTVTAAP
jgi:FkbH-like protein